MDLYTATGIAVGVGSATWAILRGKRALGNREQKPQSLGIKVTRLQKQDKKEKQKKENEKEKQVEFLFDEKQYLQSFKDKDVLSKYDDKRQKAARILMTEFESIVGSPQGVSGIGLLPAKNNLFEWHSNVKPSSGSSSASIFHFILELPDNYPDVGPKLTSCTSVGTGLYLNWNMGDDLMSYMMRVQSQLNILTVDYSMVTKTYVNPKIHHDPVKHPWPPLPKSGIIKSLTVKVETYEEKVKKQLICFYTKDNFEKTKLGLGISFTKNIRTGELQQIHCSTKLISIKAFNRYKIRKIDSFTYTHWLPVYICESHAPMKLAERSISLICTGISTAFKPLMVLQVLPKLMNTIIVDTMNGRLNDKMGLHLYCLVHRLLLAFDAMYPEISQKASEVIHNFIEHNEMRLKSVTPNLGELLALLPVTDYRWTDLKEAYYKESSIRNVFWILKAYKKLDPEYWEKKKQEKIEARAKAGVTDEEIDEDEEVEEEEITDEERIDLSFRATRMGKQILAFQIFFLNNIAQPENINRAQIAKQYDDFYGYPVDNVEKAYLEETNFIREMKVDDFLAAISIPALSDEELAAQLLRDIKRSRKRGYHGEIEANVTKPEDFAKQNRVSLKPFTVASDKESVFIDDENVWRQAAEKRWGIEAIPRYCQTWRETYLSNHVRDAVESLNESQDFDYVYSCAETCNAYISFLELELFNPTNLKSKFLFLAKVLSKLTNLRTLKLVRGEIALDDKAFKALCMGLNRCHNITSLVLENSGLSVAGLNSLFTKDLVSNSITRLNLSGTGLRDSGAQVVARFLANHRTLPNLEELFLNGCKIGNAGGEALAESFIFKTKLRHLELKNNEMRSAVSTLLEKLAYCPRIEYIDLANNPFGAMTQNALEKMLFITGSLRTLKLWNNQSVYIKGDSTIQSFANNTTLEDLDLGRALTPLSENFTSLGKILASNRCIRTLCLRSARVTSQLLVDLLEGIKLTGSFFYLHSLDLSENCLYSNPTVVDDIRKYSKKELAAFDVIGDLLSCAPNLTAIDLSSCSLHLNSIKKIGQALSSSTSKLQSLNLKRNKLGKIIYLLCEALKTNTSLLELDLSGNDLGAAGGLSVAEALKCNTSLQKLSIYGNFIEPDGCVAIVDALQNNNPKTNLRELDIGLNRIKARGIKRLIEWIANEQQQNQFPLTHIGLKDNHINDVLALKLVNAVCQNRATNNIQFLSLHGNPMRNTTVNELATELAQKNIRFDLSKLVEVKQAEKQQRSIYIPALSIHTSAEQLKRHFYKNHCGTIVDVDIHFHKKRGTADRAKYAFVEFADEDSVKIALNLSSQRKNMVGKHIIKVFRAGIMQAKKKK